MLTPTYYSLGGRRFPGLLSPTVDRQPFVANMTFPGGVPGLKNGVVVTSRSGTGYLLGYKRQTFVGRQRFLAYPLTEEVAWQGYTQEVHPVTKMAGPKVLGPAEDILVGVQVLGVTLHEGLGTDQYRYFTHHPVQVGDLINGRVVRRQRLEFGVNILEVA
jgi:hypothetical protein